MLSGSHTRVCHRRSSEKLDTALGQRVLVENRPGAGGIVAMEATRAAAPDGYTIAFIQAAVATVTPFVFKAATYDMERDFDTIATVAYSPMMFVANVQAPAKTIADAVNHAKVKPETVFNCAAMLVVCKANALRSAA